MTTDLQMRCYDRTRGFSLVELIIYIAVLSLIVSAVTVSGMSLMRTYVHMQATQDTAQAGVSALERITRELRFAIATDITESVFETHPGKLTLFSRDAGGTLVTVIFEIVDGRVMYREGGNTPVPLTHANVTVSNMVFTRAINGESEGIGVALTLQKNIRDELITEHFRTFVVLRGL